MTTRFSGAALALAVSLLDVSGCSGPLNPEAGFPLPKDPGTILVRVFDDAGAPLANVAVAVTQPNDTGGLFTFVGYTDGTGTRVFPGIPAGTRPVEVTPPAGYKAGAGGLVQNVDVLKSRTTIVTFTLVGEVPPTPDLQRSW